MIWYDQRQTCIFLRKLNVVVKDSHIWKATVMALPSGIVACVLEYEERRTGKDWWDGTFMERAVYNGVCFLACYMVFLRMKRSYKRFFDGCEKAYSVCGDWYDAMSLVIAFTRHAKADEETVENFHHLLFRLMSLLLGFVFADLGRKNTGLQHTESLQATIEKFPVLDVPGIDMNSIHFLENTEDRVEVVFNWVQSLLVDKMDQGIVNVPPPIITRVFQELGDGMIKYHEALHICRVPFPFPLAVTTECMLILVTVITPLGIISWTEYISCAAVFSFLFVFILWYFNNIATAIENPFAGNIHTLPTIKMQAEQNFKMLTLLLPQARMVPGVSEDGIWDESRLYEQSYAVHDWKTWSMGKRKPSEVSGRSRVSSGTSPSWKVAPVSVVPLPTSSSGGAEAAEAADEVSSELALARAEHGENVVMDDGDPEPMAML